MVGTYFIYVLWGGAIGVLSGLLGLGGGVVAIPTLVWLFKLDQHQAQGTTLAMMVPPIGLLAALRYHREGHVLLPIAICGALGFVAGGYFGAGFAEKIDAVTLGRVFGILLIAIGLRMVLR